jgi:hypothetical protein
MPKTIDYSLEIKANECIITEWETVSVYKGDEEHHVYTKEVNKDFIPLDNLPQYIRDNKIDGFSRNEEMHFCAMMNQ